MWEQGMLKGKASYLPSWASSLGLPVPWSFKKSLMKKTYSPMFYKITHLGASGEPLAEASLQEGMIRFPKATWEIFKISILYTFHKDSEHLVEDLYTTTPGVSDLYTMVGTLRSPWGQEKDRWRLCREKVNSDPHAWIWIISRNSSTMTLGILFWKENYHHELSKKKKKIHVLFLSSSSLSALFSI